MSSRYRGKPIGTLYVRNLSDRVRYEDLKRLFQKYGRVVDVTIPLDYYSRTPKGFCFVQYEDERDAEEALHKLDRQRLFGREIEIEFARGDRKTPGEMRTRDKDRRYPRDYDYDRRGRRSRSRSRSRDRHRHRDGSYSRSRSYSKHRSASPRRKSVSRDRSRSPIQRSQSRDKNSQDY